MCCNCASNAGLPLGSAAGCPVFMASDATATLSQRTLSSSAAASPNVAAFSSASSSSSSSPPSSTSLHTRHRPKHATSAISMRARQEECTPAKARVGKDAPDNAPPSLSGKGHGAVRTALRMCRAWSGRAGPTLPRRCCCKSRYRRAAARGLSALMAACGRNARTVRCPRRTPDAKLGESAQARPRYADHASRAR